MTAPMVDYKIHWLKMMSVPESRAVVGRHDGINGRDSRMRTDERTRAYVARRTLEGLSKREIMRCLKRYVAREIYRVLTAPSSA